MKQNAWTVIFVVLGAGAAFGQNLVLDDSLRGSSSGARSGGSFQADGWRVTGKDDHILWHLPTLPQGAVEWSVRGLLPNDARPGGEDKNEIFHMYDWTYGSADTVYDGYRNNPYKHFVRKSNPLNGPKTDSMELVWVLLTNYVEPDTQVLSWDGGTTYKFREEWGPDGAGNTVIRTYRDGQLIMTMSEPGAWNPAGHAFRIGASPRSLLYADFGAPVDAVYSDVKVWDSSAGGGGGGATWDGVRRGNVHVVGNSLYDDGGPFLGLGWTYMSALWQCRNNRAQLRSDLAFMKANGFNYLRALGQVAGNYWAGREVAPVDCRNEDGTIVPAWPDYVQQLRDLLDIAWDEYGLRTEITIFGGAGNIIDGGGRQGTVDLVLQAVAGRESKAILIEVANEGWQNGFGGSSGDAEMRAFCDYLAARTPVPVAITSNHEGDMEGLYAGTDADIATWHFSRDLGVDDGWGPVWDCWKVGLIPGFPPTSSNEPIGPGSSVNSENNPIKLVMAAAFAYAARLPMYVFHSRAGVRHDLMFEDMAGVRDYVHLFEALPPDLSSWARNDGKESSAPFTAFSGGQANRYWPETGAGDGCVRNIGGRKGGEFVSVPIGIRPGGLTLQARETLSFRVIDPLSGQVVDQRSVNPGDTFTLPAGPGAYILTNASVQPPSGGAGGLKGEYFDNIDLTGLVLTRTDARVDFDWGSGSPSASIGPDTFSVRWTGRVDPQYTETYTFTTQSDDGVRLWVNGQLLVDNWWDHGMEENSGTIALTAGQKVDVRLEYYENGGGAAVRLLWSSASQAKEVIASGRLSPPPPPPPGNGTGLTAEYFHNSDLTAPALTRTDATVNFDWGGGSPDPALAADTFSVRWTGQVEPHYSETYTFTATTDDGVRLWVNGVLVVNNWTDHGPMEQTGTIALTAGQKVDLVMEYYENLGGAVAKLLWSSASQAKEIIPQSQLYPAAAPPAGMNDAVYVSQSVPATMVAGQTYTVSVTMRNTGTTSWTAAQGYRLGSQNAQDNVTWGTNRTDLGGGDVVAPGQEKTFTFDVVAPAAPGPYNFQRRMLRELVEWFGEYTPNAIVTVTGGPASGALVSIVRVSTGRSYSLAVAQVGELAYIDRSYRITELTSLLNGGVLVRTANDDKYVAASDHLTLSLGAEAWVAVCYDVRGAATPPRWVNDTWSRSSESISTDDTPASPMAVFVKRLPAGTLVLGGNHEGGDTGALSNYFVVVQPVSAIPIHFVAGPIAPGTQSTPGDADGDGLLDTFEAAWGLDPTRADTDGDGITDEAELAPNGLTYFQVQASGGMNIVEGRGGGNGSSGSCGLTGLEAVVLAGLLLALRRKTC